MYFITIMQTACNSWGQLAHSKISFTFASSPRVASLGILVNQGQCVLCGTQYHTSSYYLNSKWQVQLIAILDFWYQSRVSVDWTTLLMRDQRRMTSQEVYNDSNRHSWRHIEPWVGWTTTTDSCFKTYNGSTLNVCSAKGQSTQDYNSAVCTLL